MNAPFIVDAHIHTGFQNTFFVPELEAEELVRRMDSLSIQYSVNLCNMVSLTKSLARGLPALKEAFEQSGRRIYYCGTFDPHNAVEDLKVLEKALAWPGFRGVKIHPPWQKTPADDPAYEPVWRFAQANKIVLVSHSWSVSSYNPSQGLAVPARFEKWIAKYPDVVFVLAHAGGRGTGHAEAVRLARDYANVFLDCAGDIYIHRMFELFEREIPASKLMYGSDWPMMDQRAHLSHIALAEISDSFKLGILRTNAMRVYGIEGAKAGFSVSD